MEDYREVCTQSHMIHTGGIVVKTTSCPSNPCAANIVWYWLKHLVHWMRNIWPKNCPWSMGLQFYITQLCQYWAALNLLMHI